jgi:hypothetical protein
VVVVEKKTLPLVWVVAAVLEDLELEQTFRLVQARHTQSRLVLAALV